MKRNWILSGFLLSQISFAVQTAQAADYATLAETLKPTLPEYSVLQNAQQVQQAAQGYAQQWIPGEVTLKLNHENDALTDNKALQTWEAGVEFPIWRSGQAQSQTDLALAYQAFASAEQQQFNLQASHIVRQLVWETKTAEVKHHFAQKALEQTQVLVNMVTQRVNAGENPRLDLLLAEKSLFASQSEFSTANFNYEMAKNTFKTKFNTLELPVNLLETQSPLMALEQHPTYLKLQADIAIETAKLAQLKSSQVSNPSLYLGGKNEQSRGVASDTFLIAQFSYPLNVDGLNGHQKVLQAEQQHLLSQKRAALQHFEQTQTLALYNAQQAINASITQLYLTEQQLLHAEKTVSLASQSYFLGETSIQNLLTTQQSAMEQKLVARLAKLQTYRTIADYNQISGVSF